MRNWLTFDGKSLKDYGVYISGNGTYNAPERDEEVISVPGKDGDIVIDNGRYMNTTVTYPAFIYNRFSVNVEALRNYLLSKRGYKRLEDTYHPEEFRMAKWEGGFETEARHFQGAGEFNLIFNCKPQRFLKSGEESKEFTSNTTIVNQTMQTAKPLLRVYGTGSFSIGSATMQITSADVYTDIDCEVMDAYKGATNCNGNISGTFPELMPGENGIALNGVSKVIIWPRWWVL